MARLLGVDPGTTRCGIAVSDSLETMAFPRPALPVDESISSRIRALVAEEESELVVVGRPLSLSGAVSESTTRADDFFVLLSQSLTVPVVQWDERLTTVEAQRLLTSVGVSQRDSRARIDSAAAVVLLEHFIEARNG